jgi:S-phase kinase-associated protein 1
MESEIITLTSSEGDKFTVSKIAAKMSQLLKGAIEDFNGDLNIPLTEINSKTLQKVVEYLEHWNNSLPPEIKKPIDTHIMTRLVDLWSATFIDNLSLDDIADLAIAANFMEIQPLVELTCCKIAAIGISKPINELFLEYGMDPSSFTEAERQIIREENLDWLNDNPDDFLRVEEDENQ